MRELYPTRYNNEDYTDENLLYKNQLIDTPTLSRSLTYLYGNDSELFPLLSLTEGQNGLTSVAPKEMNDTQYTWNVVGRMKHTTKVVGLANASNVKPGVGFSMFEIDFEDNTLNKYFSVTSPDKQSTARLQSALVPLANGKYRGKFKLITGDPTAYISLDNFLNSQSWVMGISSIPQSKSGGTTANSMTPGKWTNQYSAYRFSKPIAGNVSNKAVNIEFDLDNGKKTNLWMPWDMRQFEIDRRKMIEEDLWNSTYNRTAQGVISLIDDETGEPVSKGAGIKEILKTTGQYDTYGTLTLSKLDSILTQLFTNRVDDKPMELVLYTGAGGMRQINEAIKVDAQANNYYYKLSGEEIMSGKDGYLSYGKYFNQYKTIDGHIVTFKRAKLFDQGSYAEMDRANGRMYKGLPYESYNIILLDMSMNDNGERNIQVVTEKGRKMTVGIYRGMAELPGVWGAIPEKLISLATKKDEASYEVIGTQGVNICNYTTSYYLEFLN